MDFETPDELHIASGPRWERLGVALDQAEEHLRPLLDEAELARGWTEDLREMVLASVQDIKKDLASKPYVRRNHYKSWIKTEEIDPRVNDVRWSYALGPDSAVRDIQMAEDLLRATLSFVQVLSQLRSEQLGEANIGVQMVDALGSIASTLAEGEFVTLGEFQAWDNILCGMGVRRRVLDISYISQQREGMGANIDFIEQRPSGQVWDRIEAYDGILVNLGGRDITFHS